MKLPRHYWWATITCLGLIVYVAVMLPPRYSVLVATAIVLVGFLAVAFARCGEPTARRGRGVARTPATDSKADTRRPLAISSANLDAVIEQLQFFGGAS